MIGARPVSWMVFHGFSGCPGMVFSMGGFSMVYDHVLVLFSMGFTVFFVGISMMLCIFFGKASDV